MATFPFSAIVGQEDMKRALILTAVDPTIGGVLAFGDRGAGKSTAIRALAALLPEIRSAANCMFRCDPDAEDALCPRCREEKKSGKLAVRTEKAPVVDLPLGATEDRVVGSLDLESALLHGEKKFEPGLLARAHRGYLYVDEVNLLEDHLVDLLLDVAASGENVVEREGLSVRHAARFVLVGSGNPEEGELRPQLLDRFGLCVDVRTPDNIGERVEIVRRRDAFDRDPAAFIEEWKKKERALGRKIEAAREKLAEVETSDAAHEKAAALCIALGTDGLRGELTLIRSARALAAFNGKDEVTDKDMRAVAPLALRHRLRKDPLDESDAGVRVERAIETVFGG